MTRRKFVLEFIDQLTDCVSSDCAFEVDDVAALCEVVDPETDDIHPAATYELELEDIEELKQRFDIADSDHRSIARLRSWGSMDELPYKTHTNRELALMLTGEKPFAAFSEYLPSEKGYECIPESRFAPYVRDGQFSKKEYVTLSKNNRRVRVVLYARRGEEWRMDAYILLKKTAEKSGWSEGFERFEGSLLGYEDWQNDIYIERLFRSGKDR